jgi:hypothetical protein
MDFYPEWVSWTLEDAYLPLSFHVGEDEFNKLIKAFQHPVEDNYGDQEMYALALGLALRDIGKVISGGEHLPDYILSSVLGEDHLQILLDICHPPLEKKAVLRSSPR